MGLSAFNRARRSRLDVERLETERAMRDNANRQAAIRSQDKDNEADEKMLEKIRKAEIAASEEIGRKTEEGIKLGEEGGVQDLLLRQDHAAEIVGRSVEDAQTSTKTPLERLEARIPTSGTTANEALVEHTQVDKPGPSAELVEAARLETIPQEEREAAEKTVADQTAEREAAKDKTESELPATGQSAGAGTEASTSSATGTKKTTAKKATAKKTTAKKTTAKKTTAKETPVKKATARKSSPRQTKD